MLNAYKLIPTAALSLPLILSLAACGGDSGSSDASDNPTAKEDIVSISDKSVTGVSQKGPFLNGSSVTLQELDGKTLAQTGKSFKGKISGDKGEFSVSSVTLASQYALLEANGYYRNEVTGENSTGTLTLDALTDLSDRANVNINLLTHLEYERALYLAQEKGYNVPAAKKQASAEVLAAFGISGDFGNSEDLSIFASGEGDAALLALSVMLQGDRSEAELSALLANFGADLEKDGTWDDAQTKADIADWASSASLSRIRNNIEGWKLSTGVPAFEKYVTAYWNGVYGLGSCTDDREGEIMQDTDSLSENYRKYYICDSSAWRLATVLEYDTYGKACTKDGAVVSGNVVSTNKYTCDADTFRIAAALDTALSKACVSYTEGSTETYVSNWICEAGAWTFDADNLVTGTVTDAAGEEYRTVAIGMQTWMAENLNYADSTAMPNLKGSSWCYGNSADSCAKYGRLYTWTAAMNIDSSYQSASAAAVVSTPHQGACPAGWHIPTDDEWEILETIAGGSSTAGTKLKSTGGWFNSGNGTDTYGFSALPAGYRSYYGDFYNVGGSADFWSATEDGTDNAYYRVLNYDGEYMGTYNYYEDYAFSVRCLKDL